MTWSRRGSGSRITEGERQDVSVRRDSPSKSKAEWHPQTAPRLGGRSREGLPAQRALRAGHERFARRALRLNEGIHDLHPAVEDLDVEREDRLSRARTVPNPVVVAILITARGDARSKVTQACDELPAEPRPLPADNRTRRRRYRRGRHRLRGRVIERRRRARDLRRARRNARGRSSAHHPPDDHRDEQARDTREREAPAHSHRAAAGFTARVAALVWASGSGSMATSSTSNTSAALGPIIRGAPFFPPKPRSP